MESGIPSFRGPGAVGEARPDRACHRHAFMHSPARFGRCFRKWSPSAAAPSNAAHKGLAALERWARGAVITQNVDGLHQAAGSRRVIEYHGNMKSWSACPLEAVPDPGAADAGCRPLATAA